MLKGIEYTLTLIVLALIVCTVCFTISGIGTKDFTKAKKFAVAWLCVNLVLRLFQMAFIP